MNLGCFFVSVFLSFLAAFFEGLSVVFLIPLVKGIIARDFSFVQELPYLKVITGYLFKGSVPFSNTAVFIWLVGIIFTATILKNALQYISSLYLSRGVRQFSHLIRQVIFNRYLSFGKMFFDRNNTGYLQTVLLNFTMAVMAQFKNLALMLSSLFMLAVYFTMMMFISWRLTFLVAAIFPVLSFTLKWLIEKIRKTSGFYTSSYAALSSNIANILSCIPLVKLYTMEEKEKKNFSDISRQIERLGFSIDKKQNLIAPIQEVTILIAILFLVAFMAFMIVKEKAGEISSYLIYFFLLKRASGFFGSFTNVEASLATVSGQISSLFRVLDNENKFFIPQGTREFTGLKEKIEINHLNFAYNEGTPVLKDISLHIDKGKMLGIVGPTGSGKTTLINLILRFYDSPPASIMIDGVDIREFSFKTLRNHMALVSQDTLLFNDTLKNNIIYGLDREVTEKELIDTLQKARLQEFILSLPKGLDTSIGDKGIRLSGGERQRLSIARALLKNADILILDEASSSLDTKTEIFIQQAIEELMRGRTVICIAHRLSTIKGMDKIIVIEGGMLKEEGSLLELLEKKGKFFEYWEAQKFR